MDNYGGECSESGASRNPVNFYHVEENIIPFIIRIGEQMTDNVQQKPIEEMTVAELKALCYDQIVLLQQTQNNINLLQAEINKKTKI
jgi:hypothetical protein